MRKVISKTQVHLLNEAYFQTEKISSYLTTSLSTLGWLHHAKRLLPELLNSLGMAKQTKINKPEKSKKGKKNLLIFYSLSCTQGSLSLRSWTTRLNSSNCFLLWPSASDSTLLVSSSGKAIISDRKRLS